MILETAETVLGIYRFDRSVYGNPRKKGVMANGGGMKKEQRVRDIETEML